MCQRFWVHGLAFGPVVPGSVVQGVKELQQIGTGDPFGVALFEKGIADIGEN